jgi:ureidoacrylate peracid hydrolase
MNRRFFVRTVGAATGSLLVGDRTPAFAGARPRTRLVGSGLSGSGAAVTLDAAPSPIRIDATRTAVLVVDMQNDFGSEGGAFQRAGIDISMIRAAVAPTAKVLAAARTAGIKIVYLKMGFRPDLSDAGAVDSPNYLRHAPLGLGHSVKAPDGKESRILIRDTWNTDVVAELTPQPEDVVIYKHRFSGFFETTLDEALRRSQIRYLIVVGCTTSICVESTIRDAMFRDYSCVLLEDCAGEPIGQGLPRTNHEASLLTIQRLLGWISTSDDFIKALRARPS